MVDSRVKRDSIDIGCLVALDAALNASSKRGLLDFVAQRVSAIVLLAYAITLIIFFETHYGLTYEQWSAFFYSTAVQVFSSLVLIAICVHTWIGMWTVGTDYLRPSALGSKGNWLRLTYQFLLLLLLGVVLVWGNAIIWNLQ